MTNCLRFTPVEWLALGYTMVPGALAMLIGLEPWWLATSVAAYGVVNGLSIIGVAALKRRRSG